MPGYQKTEHKNTPLQGGAFLYLYDVSQGFRCALIVARHYVAVGVERQIGSAVAEALLHRLVAGTVLQQERGTGVTQAVEAEVFRHIYVFAVALDELAYCVRVERSAVLSRKKEAVWLPQRVAHGLQSDGPYCALISGRIALGRLTVRQLSSVLVLAPISPPPLVRRLVCRTVNVHRSRSTS